jgi:hypothetical protein
MKKLKYFFLLILIVSIYYSCSKEDAIEVHENFSTSSQTELKPRTTILGEKIDYPFTLEKMQRLYNKLYSSSRNQLDPTHKYVSFLAENAEDFKRLKEHPLIVVSHSPFDYEVIEEGQLPEGYDESSIYPLYAMVEK